MNEYNFGERMRMSNGVAATANIDEILLDSIPGAIKVVRSSTSDDRSGVDWWVKRDCGRDLGVDTKIREEDFKAKNDRYDDLALELWSDKRRRVIGWTLNKDKRTDYILWFWKDTKRWTLIPFPMLCAVFNVHSEKWYSQYKHATQSTTEQDRSWLSECIFVPRHEVWAAIYRRFGGIRTNTQTPPPNAGVQLDLPYQS